MSTLLTGYDTTKTPVFAFVGGRIYVTNNFDRVKVWNGVGSSMLDAGIAGPAAAPDTPTTAGGNGTVGTHLVRYRYLDNTSPASTYRSNSSANLSQVVSVSAVDGKMTFDIGAMGDIVPSTDAKVTSIQIEMTLASGSTFYIAAVVDNAATTVDVSIADTLLVLNDLGGLYDTNSVSTTDFGVGNDQPPLGSVIAQCRDYTFLGGDNPRTKTVGVTNGSKSVTGTGFSPLWDSKRAIRIGTDAIAYEIASSTTTTITLSNAYAGSDNASISAQIYAKNPNRIYWCAYKSGAALPESWKASRARDVLNGTGDILKGFCEFNGDLVLFGRFTMQRLVFVDDPGVGELDIIQGQFGIWNQQCLMRYEGNLYGWGPNGVWMSTGGRPRWLSRDVQTTYKALYDKSLMDQAHAHFDPVEKVLYWFFVYTGETTPRQSIAFDLIGGRWNRCPFRQGIDAGIFAADADGELRGILTDATNGRLYYHNGNNDGVPLASNGAYTGAGGSTTTVTQVNETLPTGALNDLTGLIIYQPSSGEERAISSNTASTITHTAFSVAVATSEDVYVGAIPWTYETAYFIGDGQETKKRVHLWLKCRPSTDAGSIRVRVYLDQMDTSGPVPHTFSSVSGDVYPACCTVVDGNSYIDVTFAASTNHGFVAIPMPSDWSRSIQAKLEVLSPAGTLILTALEFAKGNERESQTVVSE